MLRNNILASELPREKLIKYGGGSLSNSELISLVIRTGGNDEDVLTLANRILLEFGSLNSLCVASLEKLKRIKNVGLVKATSIKACFELSLRLKYQESSFKVVINSPGDVHKLMCEDFFEKKKETLFLLSLDAKSCFISKKIISIETINSTLISPNEVYREALNQNAVSVILVHNHPSGNPYPSKEDIFATKKIISAGNILDIPLIDHIIVGGTEYVSLKALGLFEENSTRKEVNKNA